MNAGFRPARREEVAQVVALLCDDGIGGAREASALGPYHAAFDVMEAEAASCLIVGIEGARIAATYQITRISGLSRRAARRAQTESVRVASDGRGLGAALVDDAVARARAAGCTLIQLTSDAAASRPQLLRAARLYRLAYRI